MAKKKKTEEPEPVVDLPEPAFGEAEPVLLETAAAEVEIGTTYVIDVEKKPEPLLTVRVVEDFKDGALTARFAALGYPLLWKAGETRQIPMTLFIRCKRSGAKFEL